MCKYLIHYFSGTGNTDHMVKVIERELKNSGHEVDLLNIEKDKDRTLNEYSLHIFCFPVYGFGTPSIMLRYISELKALVGHSAAILCTSAGAEGQALNHCKYLLSKKGFKVVFSDMVVYTHNWTQVINPPSKEVEERVFKKAEAKVMEITKKIINNEPSFKNENIIILTLSWIIFIIFSNLARRILGKTFIADDNCINCGKCKEVCPAKVIYMCNGKPRWKSNCESCQRCINICPKKSIQLSIMKLAIFAIFELVPILIIEYLNHYIANLPTIIDIALFLILFLTGTIIAGIIIHVLEKFALVRKLLQINYTKKFRRNVARGFKIK